MQDTYSDVLQADILVIGAGFAGVCAAIQAARLGCSVILVEKERVIGGNCGANCGVNPTGAHRYHPYAADTGIVAQIYEEAAWYRARTYTKGHDYTISSQWDTVMATMLRDAGVRLLRCHYARMPVMEGGMIRSVVVEDTAAYHTRRIDVGIAVVEASGDGHIAFQAGAEYMQGRESRREFGERMAPERPDSVTLGSSLVAVVRKTDREVEFIAPPDTPEFYPGYGEYLDWWPHVAMNETLTFFYPSETGGERDTIEDDAAIYETALKHIYSAWNYVKNIRYKEESKNWELVRVGTCLAKRESRRFVGDYVLRQQDLEEGVVFEDAVAIGGFSIDIHNPKPENPEYVKITSYSIPPIYTIPYRSLYSRNIPNLFFASRLLSASHIAHGSVRLMRTLGNVGMAVGTAAALCKKHRCLPRDIYTAHLEELRQWMLKEDASFLGGVNRDPEDLARLATVSADSETRFAALDCAGLLPLSCPRGIMLWNWACRLDKVSFYVKNTGAQTRLITARVLLHQRKNKWRDDVVTQEDERRTKGFSYWKHKNSVEWGDDDRVSAFSEVASTVCAVPGGYEGFADFSFGLELIEKDEACDEDRYIIELGSCEDIMIGHDPRYRDCVRRVELNRADEYDSYPDSHVFRLEPSPLHGEAVNVLNGINRRYCSNPVNMWIPERPLPQAITLTWPEEVELDTVQIAFDTFTRTHKEMPFESGVRAAPMCVRDYRLEAVCEGVYTVLCEVADNYHRFRRHTFDRIKTSQIRLVLLSTWDEKATPGVYEIRCYCQGGEK